MMVSLATNTLVCEQKFVFLPLFRPMGMLTSINYFCSSQFLQKKVRATVFFFFFLTIMIVLDIFSKVWVTE